MLTIHKRGKAWHADLLVGRIHAVRGALGTRNEDAARRLKHNWKLLWPRAQPPRCGMNLEHSFPRRPLPVSLFLQE